MKEYRTIKLNDEIFEELMNKDLNDVEITYLASNEDLTSEQIDVLFEKNIDNANINLLRHKNCTIAQLKSFVELNDKIYNITIAHSPNLDDELYSKLVALEDKDVDMTLSMMDNTPQKVLECLKEENRY